MVGRFASWKGQDVAIEAARRLRQSGTEVELTLAGAALFEADTEYAQKLRAAGSDGVRDGWLHFAGFVPDPYVEYARHHIALHCSRIPEPFGQVVVEAMSCALPVVTTAAGGPIEIMSGPLSNLVVTAGNAECVADRIRYLTEPETWHKMSELSLRRAASFSMERVASGLVLAFDNACRITQRRPR
jgi:glycosyltransferase involved in cell wall biosynthesis